LARAGNMTITIGRRELLAALGSAVAAWPRAARAQQSERKRRIGVLMAHAESDADFMTTCPRSATGFRSWDGRKDRTFRSSLGGVRLMTRKPGNAPQKN